jgi:hypothetical protein
MTIDYQWYDVQDDTQWTIDDNDQWGQSLSSSSVSSSSSSSLSSSSSSSSVSSSSSSSSLSSSSSSSISSASISSSSESSSSSAAIYSCSDCVDAWELEKYYSCNEAPNVVTDMSQVEIGDCVEFNQGRERIWGIIIDELSCSIVVRVLSDLALDHPFEKYDRVKLELKHIYNVDSTCSKI